jgi:hypothetical protein
MCSNHVGRSTDGRSSQTRNAEELPGVGWCRFLLGWKGPRDPVDLAPQPLRSPRAPGIGGPQREPPPPIGVRLNDGRERERGVRLADPQPAPQREREGQRQSGPLTGRPRDEVDIHLAPRVETEDELIGPHVDPGRGFLEDGQRAIEDAETTRCHRGQPALVEGRLDHTRGGLVEARRRVSDGRQRPPPFVLERSQHVAVARGAKRPARGCGRQAVPEVEDQRAALGVDLGGGEPSPTP